MSREVKVVPEEQVAAAPQVRISDSPPPAPPSTMPLSRPAVPPSTLTSRKSVSPSVTAIVPAPTAPSPPWVPDRLVPPCPPTTVARIELTFSGTVNCVSPVVVNVQVSVVPDCAHCDGKSDEAAGCATEADADSAGVIQIRPPRTITAAVVTHTLCAKIRRTLIDTTWMPSPSGIPEGMCRQDR